MEIYKTLEDLLLKIMAKIQLQKIPHVEVFSAKPKLL